MSLSILGTLLPQILLKCVTMHFTDPLVCSEIWARRDPAIYLLRQCASATISSPFAAGSQHPPSIPIPRSTRLPPFGEENQSPSGCSYLDLGQTPSLTHTSSPGQPPISLCWAASPFAASVVPPSMSLSLCPKWLGAVDTTPCPGFSSRCCPLLGWH